MEEEEKSKSCQEKRTAKWRENLSTSAIEYGIPT